MKKLFYLGMLLPTICFAQGNTFPTDPGTNVGIGTTTPSARLEISSGTGGISGVKLRDLTSGNSTISPNGKALSVDSGGNVVLVPSAASDTDTSIYNTNGTLSASRTVTMNARNLTFNPTTSNSQIFFSGSTGFVGLGTVTPVSRLDIRGALNASQGFMASTQVNGSTYANVNDRNDKCLVLSAGSKIGTGAGYANARMFSFYDFPQSNMDAKAVGYFTIDDKTDKNRYRFVYEQGGYTMSETSNHLGQEIMKVFDDGVGNVFTQFIQPNSRLLVGTDATYAPGLSHRFVVRNGSALIEGNVITNANVGIGTSNFIDGSDTYRLSVDGNIRAKRVKVYTTWADYVFEKGYDLPSIEEVASYIKENGHLKDIPSAETVAKEGIELGEMNKALLQKIEELTLYVIKLNDEIQTLKAQQVKH
ncbi:MAG TPA: hypothetical protein VK183_00890 [Flavobacterium sp.]|nr:hypothetical protein [Flavobacterium sp.]